MPIALSPYLDANLCYAYQQPRLETHLQPASKEELVEELISDSRDNVTPLYVEAHRERLLYHAECPEVRQALCEIYSALPRFSLKSQSAIRAKAQEELGSCTAGFINRLRLITDGLSRPESLEELLSWI